MKRSIIFSQAPAKIVAVLNCYEHELSEGREITIVVRTNLKGLYQFYKELGLKANIQMIEDKQTIIALGADAVTKAVFLKEDRIERFGNAKDLREYISRIDEMIEGKIKLLDSLYK